MEAYEVLLVDLDGVVFLGDRRVPGAAEALATARRHDAHLVFVTNNASRTPAQLAEHLSALGVDVGADEVVTAAMAAARRLAARLAPDSAVLVVGGDWLTVALREAGLCPVHSADDEPVAVAQGWAPDVDWAQLAEASVAIRGGAWWVATNTDRTLPSARGPLPGNGSLVAALATATGTEPEAVGKPASALFDTALATTPGGAALVVGDRLDTDILGAGRAGIDSLLVLTGVSDPEALLAADAGSRPTYLGRDLAAVRLDHPAAHYAAGEASCRDATAARSDDVGVAFGGPSGDDGLDQLRALCALTWGGGCPLQAAVTALDKLDLNAN